ncbi:uncharacterized protein [Macrobrachium rosenbergii]|uniref:uncharacterized protein isoform X4 n=1 Tax=Macrobrachium rosenbergii TaxID=79674 RepID=UPI0034D44C4E
MSSIIIDIESDVCLASVPTCSCIASCSRSFESDLESPAAYVGCVDLYRTHAMSFLLSCYLLDVCLVSVPTCSCIASCSRSFESDLESPAAYVGCVDVYRTHAMSFLLSHYLLDVCLVSVPTCSCIASCSRSFESDLESPAAYVGGVDVYRTHAMSFLLSRYLLDFPCWKRKSLVYVVKVLEMNERPAMNVSASSCEVLNI